MFFVVGVFSRKGGTGKTTLTVHLAVAAMLKGLKTVIIDLDTQASAAKWHDLRAENDLTVVSAHATRLKQVLHTAEQHGAEFVVIDTSAKTGDDAEAAAEVADLALIPCRPDLFDLQAISLTVKVANNAHLPAHIVFNCADPRSIMFNNAKQSIEIYDAKCVPCLIGDYVAFKYPLVDGRTAQEYYPNSKPTSQINTLFKYLMKELKGVHREQAA